MQQGADAARRGALRERGTGPRTLGSAGEAVQRGYGAARVQPEEIAGVIAAVLARPRHLTINEVLLRPADQLA